MTECNYNSCSNTCFSYSLFNYLSFGTKYYYVKSKTFRRRKKGKKYPALGGTAPLNTCSARGKNKMADIMPTNVMEIC